MSGYKNPPAHSKFKPGVSGNPRGRPKNPINLQRELRDELSETVTVGGRPTTKFGAIVKALVAKAAAGDLRAATAVLSLCGRAFPVDQPADDDVDPTDLAIAEASEKRERKRIAANVSAPAADTQGEV